MDARSRPALALIFALLASGLSARALAQAASCGGSPNSTQDVVEVTPGDGASGVALDAPVIARYLVEVDLDALEADLAEGVGEDEPAPGLIQLFEVIDPEAGRSSELEAVAGEVARLDRRTVTFRPERRLKRETEYLALIARPGFANAAPVEFDFETGDQVDEEPPVLDVGAGGIRLSSDPLSADCDGEPGSFVISLDFPPASDDGDEGALEYLVFLTRASGLEAPELRSRARNFEGSINMSFVLGPEEVEEPVCIVIRVVDGVGRTDSGAREVCFDPIQGNFFEPMCSVSGAPGRSGQRGFLIPSILACFALLWARRGRAG